MTWLTTPQLTLLLITFHHLTCFSHSHTHLSARCASHYCMPLATCYFLLLITPPLPPPPPPRLLSPTTRFAPHVLVSGGCQVCLQPRLQQHPSYLAHLHRAPPSHIPSSLPLTVNLSVWVDHYFPVDGRLVWMLSRSDVFLLASPSGRSL